MRFALALATLAVAALPGSALGDNPTLTGVVGVNDGFNITLNDATGKKVSRILPGTYTIVVEDHSAIHNFHLASNGDPTVDFKTGLEFIGTQSFTVTFQNNTTYAYACEPHWQTMNGEFFVRTATPPAPPPPPPPAVRTMHASVSPTGVATLTPRSVRNGRFRIVVRDRSARHGFRLAGRGVNRATGVSFKGSATWRVRLAKGLYRFGSNAKRLPGRLRVR